MHFTSSCCKAVLLTNLICLQEQKNSTFPNLQREFSIQLLHACKHDVFGFALRRMIVVACREARKKEKPQNKRENLFYRKKQDPGDLYFKNP